MGSSQQFVANKSAKELADDDIAKFEANAQALQRRFAEKGYTLRWVHLTPTQLTVPHQRLRVFPFAARSDIEDVETKLDETLAVLRHIIENLPMKSLEDFLLDEDHDAVVAARQLAQKTGLRHDHAERLTADRPPKTMWTHDHAEEFARNDIDLVPPVHHKGYHGPCGYDPQQEVDCAENAFYRCLADRDKHQLLFHDLLEEKTGIHIALVDLSQSLSWRVESNSDGAACCLRPCGKLWHRRRRRWLLGMEKMNLQAMMHNTYNSGILSDAQLSDLAGNAVNNVCFAALLVSILACF